MSLKSMLENIRRSRPAMFLLAAATSLPMLGVYAPHHGEAGFAGVGVGVYLGLFMMLAGCIDLERGRIHEAAGLLIGGLVIWLCLAITLTKYMS